MSLNPWAVFNLHVIEPLKVPVIANIWFSYKSGFLTYVIVKCLRPVECLRQNLQNKVVTSDTRGPTLRSYRVIGKFCIAFTSVKTKKKTKKTGNAIKIVLGLLDICFKSFMSEANGN